MTKPAKLSSQKRKVIEKEKVFPFYDQYNDSSYIEFHDNRKIISLTDKKGKTNYLLSNDLVHEIVCYHIDGGILTANEETKCDFGLYTEKDILILVELKGADYSQALDQISSSIDQLLSGNLKVSKVHARIVLTKTRVPNTLSSSEMKLMKRLKSLNGSLAKGTSRISENLSKLQ